ncbi:ribonuclease H2 subunit C [Catharus ustulatus]|uniref:ribonuclease H2 subunit C n=1 Tax=Catharus ustulatus TaxID=91951 RepID=UPI001409F11A|nr:ribonuclease H2 subunit C [Catharus ustulatus]
MAVRVRVPPGAPPEPLPVQLLPCRIQHDGPAPVAVFLRPRPGPGGELWASFRGRRLGGRELPLPAGYRGLLLRGEEPGDPSQAGRVTLTGSFEAITDWGADTAPAPGQGLARALQWGPLAQALHAPVSEGSDEEAEP